MDLLSKGCSTYFTWSEHLAPVFFLGLLRLLLFFGVPTALAIVIFERGNRSVFVQVLCCVIGMLLAATLPLQRLEIQNGTARGWLIALATVTLFFLPAALAFLLVPEAGKQRLVRRALYLLMIALLVGVVVQKGATP